MVLLSPQWEASCSDGVNQGSTTTKPLEWLQTPGKITQVPSDALVTDEILIFIFSRSVGWLKDSKQNTIEESAVAERGA